MVVQERRCALPGIGGSRWPVPASGALGAVVLEIRGPLNRIAMGHLNQRDIGPSGTGAEDRQGPSAY